MPLKKASGNMYPWVTHTHAHLAGSCPHLCSYCYVQAMAKRFPNMRKRYTGPPRLVEVELEVDYGEEKTIFIEHMGDMFAEGIPDSFRDAIFAHTRKYPHNTYVFQSKNPPYYPHEYEGAIRNNDMLGTTIETNRLIPGVMQHAPAPAQRAARMREWRVNRPMVRRFVTIEPILAFDIMELVDMIENCGPDFVNIGADSKGTGLPEPKGDHVLLLIKILQESGIEIRRKSNLERLLK